MSQLPARFALLLGNFVIGIAVLGLAGMLAELAHGLGVTIAQAGLLMTAGAIVLALGAPLMVWATSRFDRRHLLAASLGVVALGHFASAFAPDYSALLALRVFILACAAVFTPTAASTIALIVAREEQPGAIAFVFLGYSVAMAAGLPAVGWLATHLGWQATFACIGAVALAGMALVLATVPAGLRGAPISLASWSALARDGFVRRMLLLTTLLVSGQFTLFTYLGPLLTQLAGASVATIGTFFSIFGAMGIVGNLIATRIVRSLAPFRTSLAALLSILLGFSLWSVGTGLLAVMGTGIAFWGLGFAAMNSMQQARLVAAAPRIASAAVALNTSAVFIGQAIGSALGGQLIAQGLPRDLGYSALAFGLVALAVLAATRGARSAARLATQGVVE
jgi:predicted MFS family arabinose efflux permease